MFNVKPVGDEMSADILVDLDFWGLGTRIELISNWLGVPNKCVMIERENWTSIIENAQIINQKIHWQSKEPNNTQYLKKSFLHSKNEFIGVFTV